MNDVIQREKPFIGGFFLGGFLALALLCKQKKSPHDRGMLALRKLVKFGK